MKKLILIVSLLILSACTTLKNIDNANLNQKQQEAAAQEITNIILSYYSSATYPKIGLINDTEIAKILEQNLKKAGYAVDKPNNKNLKIIYKLQILNENSVFLNLEIENKKISKIYQLRPHGLFSITPLTIGSK